MKNLNHLFEEILKETAVDLSDEKVFKAIGEQLNGKLSDRAIKRIIMKEWQYESMDEVQSYLDWAAEDEYRDWAEERGLPTLDYRVT